MGKEFHEVASIFPMMAGDEFAALRQDIAENGLREAIWLHPDGRIIDGRNRYMACVELGVAPVYRTWDGQGSLVTFVVSLNLHRRHLTSSQKAVIAHDILPMLEAEARVRQLAALKQNAPLVKELTNGSVGKATTQAAAIVGTNRQYVSDVKAIAQSAPDLLPALRSGEKTVPQVKQEIATRRRMDSYREKAAAAPLPDQTYRVIYADPPWQYADTGATNSPSYGGTRWHYPSMSIDELCALPVFALADDDAVLFLWVTSPMLKNAFRIIEAWGFDYKTSFVWDKVRHNFGYYNSVRHELLLVAGRGKSTPDTKTLYDSVQSIERTEHSAKPDEFRRIIDDLYPVGRRIELFARCEADGWERWGNE